MPSPANTPSTMRARPQTSWPCPSKANRTARVKPDSGTAAPRPADDRPPVDFDREPPPPPDPLPLAPDDERPAVEPRDDPDRVAERPEPAGLLAGLDRADVRLCCLVATSDHPIHGFENGRADAR